MKYWSSEGESRREGEEEESIKKNPNNGVSDQEGKIALIIKRSLFLNVT